MTISIGDLSALKGDGDPNCPKCRGAGRVPDPSYDGALHVDVALVRCSCTIRNDVKLVPDEKG